MDCKSSVAGIPVSVLALFPVGHQSNAAQAFDLAAPLKSEATFGHHCKLFLAEQDESPELDSGQAEKQARVERDGFRKSSYIRRYIPEQKRKSPA
jgi:hypothetical protein